MSNETHEIIDVLQSLHTRSVDATIGEAVVRGSGIVTSCSAGVFALAEEPDRCDPESLGVDEPTGNLGMLLKRFAALEHARRERDAELETLHAELHALHQPLLDAFADAGVQYARVDGLTVHIRHDRYVSKCSDVSTEQVIACLRDMGLGYMVSEGIHTQSLKAKVAEGVEVPPQLARLLNIGEVPRLIARK